MFLSSYSPIFILLAFRTPSVIAQVALAILAAAGLSGLALALFWTRGKTQTGGVIAHRRDAGSEAAGYLAGYLLPVLAIDTTDLYFFWACTVFLALAFIVTVRSSLIQVNPILFVLGWRVIAIELATTGAPSNTRYLLTRGDVRVGDTIRAYRLGRDVLLRVKEDRNSS